MHNTIVIVATLAYVYIFLKFSNYCSIMHSGLFSDTSFLAYFFGVGSAGALINGSARATSF